MSSTFAEVERLLVAVLRVEGLLLLLQKSGSERVLDVLEPRERRRDRGKGVVLSVVPVRTATGGMIHRYTVPA